MRSSDRLPVSTEDVEALLEHQEFVRQISLRFTRDRELAEDVAQQVWLAALSRPPAHRANLRGWLARLVRSSWTDRMRAEGRRRDHELDYALERDGVGRPEPDAHEYPALFEALSELRPKYQEAVRLRYMEGLGRADIAERLGLPVDTVKTRQRRALEQLRQRLGPREASLFGRFILFRGLAREGGPARWLRRIPEAALTAPLQTFSLVGLVLFLAVGLPLLLLRSDTAGSVPGEQRLVASDPGEGAPPRTGPVDRAPDVRAPAGRDGSVTERVAAGEDVGSPATLYVRLVREGSEVPAAGVEVLAESGTGVLRGRTDANGELRMEGLPPGTWRVTPAVGRPMHLRLAAQDSSPRVIAVPAGMRVHGAVRAGAARTGVRGVEIWASFPGRTDVGRVVGRSGPGGVFDVDGVDPRSWLAVVEDDWFRSPKILEARSSRVGSSPVVLPVEQELARIARGVVRDAAGRPVVGAAVALELPSDPLEATRIDNDGRRWAPAPTPSATTDGAGHYELRGAGLHTVRSIVARASGFVAAVGVARPGDPVVDFVLARGTALTGRVESWNGIPARHAVVEAVWEGAPAPREVHADGRGEFVFDALPIGRVELRARAVDLQGFPLVATGELDLAAGESRWEVAMKRGAGIRGVVVGEDGVPAEDWLVTLSDRGGSVAAQTLSDGRGRFAFAGLDAQRWELGAAPADRPHWASARAEAVLGDEVRLLVGEAQDLTVRGVLVDELASPRGGCELELASGRLRESLVAASHSERGAFEFRRLPAGSYVLGLRVDAGPVLPLRELQLDADLDLGDVIAEMPGALRVWLHRAGEEARAPAHLTISRMVDGEQHVVRRAETVPVEQGWYEVSGLPPGTYRLHATARRTVPRIVDIEVSPGEPTEVRVPLERGVRLVLEVEYPASAGPVVGLDVEIRSASGRSLLDLSTQVDVAGGVFERRVTLPEEPVELSTRLRREDDVFLRSQRTVHVSAGMQDQVVRLRLGGP